MTCNPILYAAFWFAGHGSDDGDARIRVMCVKNVLSVTHEIMPNTVVVLEYLVGTCHGHVTHAAHLANLHS